MEFVTRSTGFTEQVDNFENKIPEFDLRSGNHFWIIMGSWKCDPEKIRNGEQALLDHENLVSVSSPGCFYCEKPYTPLLATQRCRGE